MHATTLLILVILCLWTYLWCRHFIDLRCSVPNFEPSCAKTLLHPDAALGFSWTTMCAVSEKHQLQSPPPTVRGRVIWQPTVYCVYFLCYVKWQTSHQISAKSVNICNSYCKFSKVTQRHQCPLGTGMIDCQVCVRANSKMSAHLKSVQNVYHVLEPKLEDMDATAWPLYRWPLGGNVPTFRSGETSAGRCHESGCGTHAPAASPNLAIDWVKVRTVGWPQSWSDEVWCFIS